VVRALLTPRLSICTRRKLIELATREFGQLDILVNNAGVRSYLTVVEASEESWDEILGVNVKVCPEARAGPPTAHGEVSEPRCKGYAFCAKYAIPAMAASGGGSIVNIASHRALVCSAHGRGILIAPQIYLSAQKMAPQAEPLNYVHGARPAGGRPEHRAVRHFEGGGGGADAIDGPRPR
jgi:NAD(P)-dependent dehydrogenase (short-subunit alcohol dehydrogenase family)